MKIGFDAKRLFRNAAGLGNYSRTLVHNLAAAYPQHEYRLYSPKGPNLETAEPFAANYPTTYPKGPLKALWRTKGMVKALRRDGLDVYHGLSHELPMGLQHTHIARVVTMHDLIFRRYPATYPALDRKVYDVKFAYACRQAQQVVAISESTKRDIMHYYGTPAEKIAVVYQSCQPEFFEPQEARAAHWVFEDYGIPQDYLLSVGTIETRKNLKLVVDAYAQLPDSLRLPWVIVGRPTAYKDEILKAMRNTGFTSPVIWVEGLHETLALKALYDHAQALVYPSRYEGFGLPVAEALLCGTPVITSTASSLPEAGGPHSRLVDPDDAGGMAKAIDEVLTDRDLRQKMMQEGKAYAQENFSPQNTAAQLMRLYVQLVG